MPLNTLLEQLTTASPPFSLRAQVKRDSQLRDGLFLPRSDLRSWVLHSDHCKIRMDTLTRISFKFVRVAGSCPTEIMSIGSIWSGCVVWTYYHIWNGQTSKAIIHEDPATKIGKFSPTHSADQSCQIDKTPSPVRSWNFPFSCRRPPQLFPLFWP